MREVTTELAKLRELGDSRDAAYTKRFDQLETSLDVILKKLDALSAKSDRPHPPDSVSEANSTVRSSAMVVAPPSTHSYPLRSIKLDFPKFDGTEPLHWLFRAEQFFDYYGTPDDQRLAVAAVNMEGMVVAWFQMMKKANHIPTWADLARAVETQFGPSEFDSPRARLFKLTQVTSAGTYYTEFLVLANCVEGLSTEAILDCFVSGLKPELRRVVMAFAPQTLIRAADLARLFDDNGSLVPLGPRTASKPWSSSGHGSSTASPKSFSPTFKPSSPTAITLPTASSGASSSPSTMPAFKRLSAAEIRAKREKGLCYYCDSKYTPSHNCKPSFSLLMDQDELHEMMHDGSADADITAGK